MLRRTAPSLYVPLLALQKGEVRAFRLDMLRRNPSGRLNVGDWPVSLPPGFQHVDDLPKFSNSDDCYAHIQSAWPHLQP